MKAKERALARKVSSNNPNEHLSIKDMATRTPFVRMASNKSNVRHNKLIEGGLRDGNFENKQFGFSKAYDDGKFGGEIKPLPGIKSIECSYKGGFKAIRECTVSWVVPHIDMLNELTPHFFTVGKTVVVDWGWVYGNKKIDSQLVDTFIYFGNDVVTSRVNDREVNNDIRNVLINPNIFNNPQDLILKKDGDYDAIGGQITNFEYNLREDGGFDCTTKIISMGAALFKKPIDRGGNQAGLQVRGKTAKSTPPDSLVNCILNLKNIILTSVFNIKPTVINDVDALKAIKKIATNSRFRISKVKEGGGQQTKNPIDYGFVFENHNVYRSENREYAINFDKIKGGTSNILWTLFDDKMEFFVTWGWMEDNIINRYVSFEAGDDKSPKLTMRSIDTVLNKDGLPIPTKDLGEDAFTPGGLQDEYDIDLNTSELNNFVKRETLIRNPPGLFPVNPFAFFIPETTYNEAFSSVADGGIQFAASFFGLDTENKGKSQFYKNFLQPRMSNVDAQPKLFASNKVPGFGKLRNIWVNIKEIQKAFGISNPDSTDTSTSNINPPGTIDVAIKNLLTNLNSNFHNVWDFELGLDPYDSTNIKVIDKSDAEVKNPQYTNYQENSNSVQDKGGGIFQFPTFKVGSFVKSQNLTFKIPDAQAITILYGSNKSNKDNDPEFANGQLDKIFRNNKTSEFDDRYLKNMKSSHQNKAGQNGRTKLNIGSQNANPNSKISFSDDFGIKINPRVEWWRKWTPELDETKKQSGTSNDKTKDEGYYEVETGEFGPKVKLFQYGKSRNPGNLYDLDKGTGHLILNSKVQYTLNSYLNSNSPVQQFDMSNLIPAELGLEIDGTGGIIPFDLIHTEYIEEKYKSELISYAYLSSDVSREAGITEGPEQEDNSELSDANIDIITAQPPKAELGPLTYFQLFDVTHKIDETGWKTELNSKMRINHIPRDDFVTFVKEEEAPPPERPFIPVPSDTNVDIEGDVDEGDTSFDVFEDVPEFDYIPVTEGNRPNIPVPMEEEDIVGDEDLEDLDFDDIPPWIPPPYPSTLALRRAKTEIENQPERVPDVSPPGPPLLDVGPVLGPDEIDKLIANAITNGTAVNNNTDLVEYPPEPDPRVEPVLPSQPIRRGGDYGNLNPLSLLDQIKSQKIIYVQPAPELTNETGEVQKPQRFEAPQVEELNFESPVEATIAVNENIKKELPKEIVVATPQELNFIEKKSTYNFSYEHNQILYALREDWRPLYEKADRSLTGARYTGRGEDRVENTLVRSGQPKAVRQAYWDAYIEGKNESGKSQTKFVDKDNFQIFPLVEPTGDLLRRERDTYWKGEWNPRYTPPS
ncbi:hypothetical protein OAV48_01175 [bacterium]|nr:hypothetical protein [bacterium]